jgi:hypothetical protein
MLLSPTAEKVTKERRLRMGRVSKIKTASYFDFFNISPSLRILPLCPARRTARFLGLGCGCFGWGVFYGVIGGNCFTVRIISFDKS